MTLTQLFLDQLEREAARTRPALQNVPKDKDDWVNHLAHHRGQLTVYLRLNDRPVPPIYGPSADDRQFA